MNRITSDFFLLQLQESYLWDVKLIHWDLGQTDSAQGQVLLFLSLYLLPL